MRSWRVGLEYSADESQVRGSGACLVSNVCLVTVADRRKFPERDVAQPVLHLCLPESRVTNRAPKYHKLMIGFVHR